MGERRKRPWRFEARWIRREECEGIVRDSWGEHIGKDSFERVLRGVEGYQMGLRLLVRGSGSSPHKQIKKLRGQIVELEQGELNQRSKEKLGRCRRELEHLYMDEEIYWRQRCKNQ